jgi:hypothetical protein
LKRILVLAFLVAMCAAVMPSGGTSALADYGQDAQYQIEISSNIPGTAGGGIWLWIELDQDGTGTYQGSDCGHAGQGSAHDSGDLTWADNGNGTLTIHAVVLNGLPFLPPQDITVQSAYGHVMTDFATLFPDLSSALGIPSGVGFSQLQVAP